VAALITRRRLLRVGGFASAQLVVQVLGFVSGIALVQFMEPTEYGHYTLAVSMVGLASVLLDLGLSTAVLAQGGPLHDDPPALGALVADAFVIQRLLMLLGALNWANEWYRPGGLSLDAVADAFARVVAGHRLAAAAAATPRIRPL
jgi:hypothetical protein